MKKEFLRYLFASAGALFVDYVMLIAAVSFFGVHYMLGAAAGFISGSVVVYFLSTHWVFGSRRLNCLVNEFAIFFGIGLASMSVGLVVIWLCTEIIGFFYLLSKIVSTGVVFLINFFMRRYFLFRVTHA